MANITDFFIDSLYNISKRELEHKYVEIAQRCILDYLGVTLAGASMLSSEMNSYLGNFLNEGGSYTVIGMNSKTTLYNAVFVNGFNAHVAELDDGHRYAAVHPGAPIISALLPLLEGNRVSENDLIRGLIVGYEATIVLGRSIQPYHKKQGFHTTGTCGTVGAAMAVSAAMRFSKQMMKNALSAAVTSASGVLEVIDDSSQIKPYNSGKAALNGLLSAFIGNAGLNGPEDVLGGKRGFLAVMGDPERPGIYEQTDMSSLAIEGIYLKPYAACRHCHPAIEAAICLRENHNLDYESVAAVRVITYDLAVFGHDHSDVRGIASAKMSIPFGVALALKFGKAGMNEFSNQTIEDNELLQLSQRVEVLPSEELSNLVPDKRGAIVEVDMESGNTYSYRVDFPKGEPENPLTNAELYQKFLDLAQFSGMSVDVAKSLVRLVEKFGENAKPSAMFAML